MHRLLIILLLAPILVAPAGALLGQKKPTKCEVGPRGMRNWELVGRDYVYFDYVICPADINPRNPLVRVWITTRGNGIALEKWTQDRQGADNVSMFNGEKKAYTIYRDLNAIPLTLLKAERRSSVPADVAGRPFLGEGVSLIPIKNLTPDSAKWVEKAFEEADSVIKKAEAKEVLLYEAPRIGAIVESLLDHPPKQK